MGKNCKQQTFIGNERVPNQRMTFQQTSRFYELPVIAL